MITVENVTVSYRTGADIKIPDVTLDSAESLVVLGRSGQGKSTLIHLLAGLITAQSGVVSVAGINLADLTERARDAFRANSVGIVFQKLHLFLDLTALENITFAQNLAGNSINETHASELLAFLGLQKFQDVTVARLSHGQAQRVAIARAIVNRPKIILADEPTSSLDDENAASALKLLIDAAKSVNAALLVATHDRRIVSSFSRVQEFV